MSYDKTALETAVSETIEMLKKSGDILKGIYEGTTFNYSMENVIEVAKIISNNYNARIQTRVFSDIDETLKK